MQTKPFNRYSYEKLYAAAVAPNATQIDIDTLGEWFSQYGRDYWNGEYYDAGGGNRLFEIVQWDDAADQGDVIGYKFR